MKRLFAAILLLLCLTAPDILAKVRVSGFAQKGGKNVPTTPSTSYKLMETFPNATVTVYLTGTTTLATIYSDNAGTVKANPFTANSDASFFFYADDGRYDIKLSGTGIVTPFNLHTDIYVKEVDDSDYVLSTRTVTAGTGLTGGGNLGADISLALAPIGAGGTCTTCDITFDTYGRVTSATTGAGSDSNISGVLSASLRPGLEAFFNGQAGLPGGGGSNIVSLGRAFSADGYYWREIASVPILTAGGGWEGTLIHAPYAIVVNGKTYLYYDGYDGTSYRIGVAISDIGGDNLVKSASNPIINIGGAHDAVAALFPIVLYDEDETDANKKFKMWYSCTSSSLASLAEDMCYAYGPDGISYTKFGKVLSRSSGWESFSLLPGAIYRVGNKYYMYYVARDATGASGFYQTGLVTFTNPEGTYTKDLNNPILPRESSKIQTLTANHVAGTNVATVTTTTAFNVGDWIIEAGNAVNAQINKITAKTATTLTLQDAALYNYTTASGAKIKGIGSSSVHIRAVIADGGKFRAYVTGFNYFQEFGQLFEITLYATSDSLEGPFVIDNIRGPFIKPIPGNWNATSLENVTIIPLNRFVDIKDSVALHRTALSHQSILHNTATAIIWQSASINVGDNNVGYIWNSTTNPTRLTAQREGLYDIEASGFFASNTTGLRLMFIVINGDITNNTIANDLKEVTAANSAPPLHVKVRKYMKKGDYAEIYVQQTSGVSLNFHSNFINSPIASMTQVQ